MSNSTPGPWSFPKYPKGVSTLIYAAAGADQEAFPVASATYGVPDEEREANARLIAAAPELLEVAQSMLQYLPADYVAKVRAVIAKATGQ